MATHRDVRFPSTPYVEPTPLTGEAGKVQELGVSSAPLKSASFFLGEHCQKYNEDFMLCKNEDRNPEHCLKEGRRVTRCAQDLIKRLGESCGKEWEDHWQCLEMNNQEFYPCRKPESGY
jgi:NADH dehydrogenase (ubiquinone) 1 alpha subcomplex subunit 8